MNSRFKLCASVLLLSVVGWGTVQTAAQEPTRSDEQIQLSHLDNNSVKKKDSLSTGKEIRGLINNADSLLRTRPDSALSLLKIAEEKSLHIGNFDKATLARIKMGLAAISIGDFDQSFSHYGTAYRYVQQAKNYDQLLPWILIDIGTIYTHQHQYERATQHYLVVLEFLEKYNPKHPNRIIAYSNLGAVLINTGQYERADEYLRLAGELASEIGDDYYLAYTLGNRGGVALGRKRYSTALDFYKQANHIAQHIGNFDLQQGILTAIGQTMLALDLPDSAIFYTQKALELDPPTNSFNSTSVPYYTMGIAWYKKKGYREAEAALLKGLLQIRKTDLAEERAEAINTLSHIYAATNKPEKAFQYAQQYISLKDSLLNKEKLRIINQLEAAYRTVQKDKELAQQHLKIVAQKQTIERKNILITGSITGIGLLSILLLVFHRNSRHRQNIIMLKAMIEGEERERSRLAQELHDGIGGMMAAIQMRLSNTNGAEIQEIKGLVADTANEIRKTAHNLMPDIIQRYGLIDALRIYTANINRSANGLHMELQVHHPLPKLNHTQELSLYRVLQEITHNILKHADATTAIIQISYQQPLLNIIVEDDGKGFHVNDTRMGLGIRNMQLRIKLLNGTCLIESAPNIGTTVNISIPA